MSKHQTMAYTKTHLLLLVLLLLLTLSLIPISSSTLTSTITLPLPHHTNHPRPVDTYDRLSHLAKTSLARAHRLKDPNRVINTDDHLNHQAKTSLTRADHPKNINPILNHQVKTFGTRADHHLINTDDEPNNPAKTSLDRADPRKSTATVPLSFQSYGGYSISLKFGTPPQTIPLVMDTGSSLVWVPCTQHYACARCNFASSTPIKPFIPKLSSTSKLVGCYNHKCGWLFDPNPESRCNANSSDPTQLCPSYLIIYGSGSTSGITIVDTLHLNDGNAPEFLVGCSLLSTRQPAGIAGFGRGNESLPSQLGLAKFSYCSPPHVINDSAATTTLNLFGKSNSADKSAGITYTPFIRNPNSLIKRGFSDYYYIGLNAIFVGDRKVKSKNGGEFLSRPNITTGHGGAIIDSGTTLTYMSRDIMEGVAREFEEQVMGEYERVKVVEGVTGLRPCYNISGHKTVSFPSLKFHFKGGAEMVFPLENYFSFSDGGGDEVVCLTMVTDPPGQELIPGPAVIFGNFQQQNFYLEYDLKHNKLGFKQQKCT